MSPFALTRSLRSLRSGELIVLRAPAKPAPSAVLSLPAAGGAASGGIDVRRRVSSTVGRPSRFGGWR
jgi:hypothetical protein